MEKIIVDREQEIIFTNFTNKDFEETWDKKLYRFTANKAYYLPFYLAEYFAKHLVDRELNRMDKATNHPLRQSLLDKCVNITDPGEVGVVRPHEVPVREVKLATDSRRERMIEEGVVGEADVPKRAKARQPRPVPNMAPNAKKPASDEESFEGLKDKNPEE